MGYKWRKLLYHVHRFLKSLGIPLCDGVEYITCFYLGKNQRQHTFYTQDSLNWVFLCKRCAKINAEYWDMMDVMKDTKGGDI